MSARPALAAVAVLVLLPAAAEARPGDRDLRFGGGDALVTRADETGAVRSARLPDGKLVLLTADRLLRLEGGRLQSLRRLGAAGPVAVLPDGRHGTLLARSRPGGLELTAVDPRGGVRRGFGSGGTLAVVPAAESDARVVPRRAGGALTASVVRSGEQAGVRIRAVDGDGRSISTADLGPVTASAGVLDLAAAQGGGAWVLTLTGGGGAPTATRLVRVRDDGRADPAIPPVGVAGFDTIAGVDHRGGVVLLGLTDGEPGLLRVGADGARGRVLRTPDDAYFTAGTALDARDRVLGAIGSNLLRLTAGGATDRSWRRGGVQVPRPPADEYDPYASIGGLHPRRDGTLDVVLQRGEEYDDRFDFEDFPRDVAVLRLEGEDLVRLDAAGNERATVRCLRSARTACRVVLTARVRGRVVARTTARVRAGTRRTIPFGAPRGASATVRATDGRRLVSTARRRVR